MYIDDIDGHWCRLFMILVVLNVSSCFFIYKAVCRLPQFVRPAWLSCIASNRRWDMMRSRNHPKATCFTGCLSLRKTRYSLKDRPLWTLLVESSGNVRLLIYVDFLLMEYGKELVSQWLSAEFGPQLCFAQHRKWLPSDDVCWNGHNGLGKSLPWAL